MFLTFLMLIAVIGFLSLVLFYILERNHHRNDNDGDFSFMLPDPWYSEIAFGRLTVLALLGNYTRYRDYAGKQGNIYSLYRDDMKIEIIRTSWYPDLYTYVAEEDVKQYAPHLCNERKAIIAYHEFYTDQRINDADGIWALEFRTKK
jgi:hypothetical protein